MPPEGCFSVYVGPERERFVVHTECVNHQLFQMRRRRNSSTPPPGRSSSPAASSSSKGCCARWSKTRWSYTRLGATSPNATPRALLQCRLGPANAWQGWLPPGSASMIGNQWRRGRRSEWPTINRPQPPKEKGADLLGRASRQ